MAKIDLSGLDLEGLNTLIEDATKLRDQKVDDKRAELLKQLEALDAIGKPVKSVAQKVRNNSGYTHKHPTNGSIWAGRGGVPHEWRDLIPEGTTADERKATLAKHRVSL